MQKTGSYFEKNAQQDSQPPQTSFAPTKNPNTNWVTLSYAAGGGGSGGGRGGAPPWREVSPSNMFTIMHMSSCMPNAAMLSPPLLAPLLRIMATPLVTLHVNMITKGFPFTRPLFCTAWLVRNYDINALSTTKIVCIIFMVFRILWKLESFGGYMYTEYSITNIHAFPDLSKVSFVISIGK